MELAPVSAAAGDEEAVFRARLRRRRRWQVACGAALALAVTSFATALASSVYEARGSVLIRPPSHAGLPVVVGGALQSEVEVLRSSEVLRQALEKLGAGVLYPGLPGETVGAVRAAAIDRMRQALRVRTLPGSDVIEVTFRHADAQLAADAVNRLVERYQRARRAALAPATSRLFLTERIAEERLALDAAEAALAAFHAEHPELAGPDPRRALSDRRLAREAELVALRDAAEAARSATVSQDASVVRARTRLDELELELRTTLNTHVEGSRAASKLRSEIERVQGYLTERESAAKRQQEERLERLRSRQRELEAELVGLGQAERELAELERRARELTREHDAVARQLDAYQRELEAATLAADVGQHELANSVRVLEAAQPPESLMIPEERVRQAWALIGGALVVLLLAYAVDLADRRSARRQPLVWTAHVGAGAEAGSLALLMPGARRSQGRAPVVLLVPGASESSTAPPV